MIVIGSNSLINFGLVYKVLPIPLKIIVILWIKFKFINCFQLDEFLSKMDDPNYW